MNKIIKNIEINTNVPTDQLATFRMFIGVYLLFFYRKSWSWLDNMPLEFFNPSKFNLPVFFFNDFLSPPTFVIIDIIFYCLVFCIIIGFFSRFSFLGIVLLSIFANSFQYSLGKIDHDILLWGLILMMVFTNSGTKYCVRKDKVLDQEFQKTALSFFSIAICFGLFTAGFPKLISWVDFDLSTNGFLRWFYSGYFGHGRVELLAPLVFSFKPWMLEIIDYTAVIFEISGLIFLLSGRNFWRIYLIMAIFFHVGNILLLNIDFKAHFLVYGVFIVSPFILKFFRKVRDNKWLMVLLGSLVFMQLIYSILRPFVIGKEINENLQYSNKADLIISIIAWSCMLIIYLISVQKKFYKINEK